MTAQDTLRALEASCIIGIVRTWSEAEALNKGRRILQAGLPIVEVSLSTPGALDVVARLTQEFPAAIVGAGTVTEPRAAQEVIDRGGKILVSPTLDADVVELAVRHDIAVLPGCLTPSEMMRAAELGATAVKLFPAQLWSPTALAGLLQALPDLPCVPTGGIGLTDAGSWIRAGATAVGIGATLTESDDVPRAVSALRGQVMKARAGRG